MGYEKTTIAKIIDDIFYRKMYLPAIQRKYVWSDNQIIKLMDSLMRGYPIGTFLFWKVSKGVVTDKGYSMYDFIQDFHERDMYKNKLVGPFLTREETMKAVLDGQQRLTSLYIVLEGSVTRKLPNKRWKNPYAFVKKELYFNLFSKGDSISKGEDVGNEERENLYEFKFFNENDESLNQKTDKLWFKVKDILKYSAINSEFRNTWTKNIEKGKTDQEKDYWRDKAIDNAGRLFDTIRKNENINYFEVETDTIDDVLDIFVRVNAGGVTLSKTDLLFSTIVSHWDNGREKIDQLLSEINKIGDGFNFTNDFIMRACLYVLDMPISLKVETFKKDSVQIIRDNWNKIEIAIKDTANLLYSFGFNRDNIISYVAILPILYYRFKFGNGIDADIVKEELRKYYVIAQIKQIFGASTNSALVNLRNVLKNEFDKNHSYSFDTNSLINLRFSGDRTLHFTAEEVDEMFGDDPKYEFGPYSFMLLTLLYPNLNYSITNFHQDHMHPYSSFEEKSIAGLRLPDNNIIDDTRISEWKHKRNTLANLQLLDGRANEKKNAMPLKEWLKNNADKAKYLPNNISYELNNFEEFLEQRKQLMSAELKAILKV